MFSNLSNQVHYKVLPFHRTIFEAVVSNPFLYMLAVQDSNFLSNDTQENSTELVPAGEEADLIRLRVGAKELLSSSDVQEILSFFNPADQALEHLSDWRVFIVRLKCIFFIVVNLMIIRGGWTKGSHCTKAVLWIIPIYNLISKCQDNRKDDVHNWIVYYCSCLIDQIAFASYNVSSKDGSIASWEIEPLVVYGFVFILCWTRHDPKIKILSNWLTRHKEGWIPFGDQNNIAGKMRQIQQSNNDKEDWFQASIDLLWIEAFATRIEQYLGNYTGKTQDLSGSLITLL